MVRSTTPRPGSLPPPPLTGTWASEVLLNLLAPAVRGAWVGPLRPTGQGLQHSRHHHRPVPIAKHPIFATLATLPVQRQPILQMGKALQALLPIRQERAWHTGHGIPLRNPKSRQPVGLNVLSMGEDALINEAQPVVGTGNPCCQSWDTPFSKFSQKLAPQHCARGCITSWTHTKYRLRKSACLASQSAVPLPTSWAKRSRDVGAVPRPRATARASKPHGSRFFGPTSPGDLHHRGRLDGFWDQVNPKGCPGLRTAPARCG